MASEPEKKIEELLHGYARKRRENAGDSVELHPATRRMLQGEVAKLRAAQPQASRPWWRSFFLALPRFAPAVGMVAVLAVGVWVVTQSENQKSGEMTQIASPRPSADNARSDDLRQVKAETDTVRKLDELSATAPTTEEAGKKLAVAKRPNEAMLSESKVQLRAEKQPAAPNVPEALVRSEVMREKNVALAYDLPAQQPAPAGDALAANSKDKGLAESLLVKQKAAESDRYYKEQETRSVKLNDSVGAERLGTVASLSLANKPADFIFTNVLPGLAAPKPDGAYVQPNSGLTLADNEAAADRLDLAKTTQLRARSMTVNGVAAPVILGQEFVRQDASGAAVLQKFELQFVNGRVRINDADGSVYEGDVLALADADARKEVKDETQESVRLLARADSAATPISFRAAGTNKLRQRVVIDGQILAETAQLGLVLQDGKAAGAPAPSTPAPAAAEPRAQSAAQPQGPASTTARYGGVAGGAAQGARTSGVSTSTFSPTTIRGRLQVGSTNQMNFRAVRTR